MSSQQKSFLEKYPLQTASWVFFALAIIFTIWTIILGSDSKTSANSFQANVEIEICVGGFFLFWTLCLGLWAGEKYLKKKQFYENIKPVLRKIKRERECGKIVDKSARDLVIEISSSFGGEILIPDSVELNWNESKDKCNVCDLKVQLNLSKTHCANCHLDCFLWEDL